MLLKKPLKTYRITITAVNSLFFFLLSYVFVFAAGLKDYAPLRAQEEAFIDKAEGFDVQSSVGSVVADVIQAFLGLLGIIFVILIILGGYNWMTASGNEEKVTKAKETLTRAVIGLVIVISAYAITYFVFSNLDSVGSVGTTAD